MNRRYPLRPLLKAMDLTLQEAAVQLGISGATRNRLRDEGLTEKQADRYAVRAGLHPWTLWPEMEQHAFADAQDAEEQTRQHRRRRQAEWARRKYQEDAEHRAAKRAANDFYKQDAHRAVLAAQRTWRENNAERVNAAKRAWHEAHRVEVNAQRRARYKATKRRELSRPDETVAA